MTNRDILGNSVVAGHRPAWPGVGSWLTLLIALSFAGICGAVWVNNEAMAVWLFSEGMVQESTTRTLPGTIRSWAMWSGISGLVMAQLVLLWGIFGITPWAPVQALVTQAWKAVRPVVNCLRAFARAFIIVTRRVLAELLRPLGSAFAASAGAIALAVGYTWQVVSTPVIYVFCGVVLGMGSLQKWVVGFGLNVGQTLALALRYTWLAVWTPVAASWRVLVFGLGHLRMGVSTVQGYLGRVLAVALRYTWLAVWTLVAACWRVLVLGLGHLRRGVSTVQGYLGGVLAMALRYTWLAVWTLVAACWRVLVLGLGHLRISVFGALRHLSAGISAMALPAGLVLALVGSGVLKALGYLGMGMITVLSLFGLAAHASARTVGQALRLLGMGIWTIVQAAGLALPYLYRPVLLVLRVLGLGVSTIAMLLAATWGGIQGRAAFAPRGAYRSVAFAGRTIWTGFGSIPDLGKTAVWIARHRKGVCAMSDFSLTRQRVLSLIATLWLFAILGSILGWTLWPAAPEPTVRVVHWTTGHLTRDGLLKDMAIEFNKAGHIIGTGTKIVVEVYDAPSELQGKYLSELLRFGTRRDLHKETNGYVVENIPDPTIVTPSSAHWLVTVNYEVGRPVVDLDTAQIIVRPVIGIVTYEEMAKCLGWPQKKIGFADIIALRNDPQGWASYPCAKAEWGKRPLLAFTDPTTSSTGRSLHLALYSFAAGKSPEYLAIDDVNDPEVVDYVKEFQGLIDHYLIGTTVLNTKIYQGPRYGHFFIMPEDNLIHLYEGTEKSYMNGIKTTAPPIEERMVMIYPKEGSMPRKNCACIVQANWVSEEQVEASQQWIDFIREDEQQRAFMAAGFRPGTDLDLNYVGSKITKEFGLNPQEPRVVLNPSLTRPEVAAAIDANWELVKRPGIVTFVVDTSGSMMGDKLRQAKDGLQRALGNMRRNNQVGLVTFSDGVSTRITVAPLAQNRFTMADTVHEVRAWGETALYDAIRAGIEMTDAAEGEEAAIRAVVVLTDGRANRGRNKLHDLIQMSSSDETAIRQFAGFEDDSSAVAEDGAVIGKANVIGDRLAIGTRHTVQVFYIGIGDDADMDVGRILAEATGAEFQGVTEDDLANVLEEFSKYF